MRQLASSSFCAVCQACPYFLVLLHKRLALMLSLSERALIANDSAGSVRLVRRQKDGGKGETPQNRQPPLLADNARTELAKPLAARSLVAC